MEDSDSDLEALKRVARRMDDLFTIDLQEAPGFTFVAAKFTIASAGEAGRTWNFSAGAADPDSRRAFRRCIGEAVETISQFSSTRGEGDRLAIQRSPDGLEPSEIEAMKGLTGQGGTDTGWVSAIRLADGGRSSVPAVLCFRDVDGNDRAGLSLGCAAGPTIESATRSALLELIERDAVALWWRGGMPAGRLAEDVLEQAGTRDLLDRMRRERAERKTWFLDLTTDIGVPVIAALSSLGDGLALAFGFAARETPAACIRPALQELAQMELGNALTLAKLQRGGASALAGPELRQLDRLSMLSAGMARFVGVEPPRNHLVLAPGDDNRTIRALVDQLAAMRIFPHMVELTRGDLGVPVAKVIAPQLQPEPGDVDTHRLSSCRNLHASAGDGVSWPAIL